MLAYPAALVLATISSLGGGNNPISQDALDIVKYSDRRLLQLMDSVINAMPPDLYLDVIRSINNNDFRTEDEMNSLGRVPIDKDDLFHVEQLAILENQSRDKIRDNETADKIKRNNRIARYNRPLDNTLRQRLDQPQQKWPRSSSQYTRPLSKADSKPRNPSINEMYENDHGTGINVSNDDD